MVEAAPNGEIDIIKDRTPLHSRDVIEGELAQDINSRKQVLVP